MPLKIKDIVQNTGPIYIVEDKTMFQYIIRSLLYVANGI